MYLPVNQDKQASYVQCASGCCLGLNAQMAHHKTSSVLFVLSEFEKFIGLFHNVMVISTTVFPYNVFIIIYFLISSLFYTEHFASLANTNVLYKKLQLKVKATTHTLLLSGYILKC